MFKIGLTLKEKAFQADQVWPHIYHVQLFLIRVIEQIHVRLFHHDLSKLSRPEVTAFAKCAEQLETTDPSTLEHKRASNEMKKAIEKHYASNRHHPEHFESGINGMNLIDLIEMLCDWKALSLLGEVTAQEFLDDAADRYGINDQLYNVLANTLAEMDE